MHPPFRRAGLALAACATVSAHAQPSTQSITVTGHYDNAVGSSDAASQGVINRGLLKSRPALRPGEVLEFVPGLIVTQHSGDGKANQYFLRGFNLDHGTDFATRINGMPVNMPSHGHGQGYTDLNFLMPELVQRIEYRKGPYFAGNGDFSSAGSADIVYLRQFDAPLAQFTLGENGFRRGAGGASFAVEVQRNDGPWTVPENLKKENAVFTLSGGTAARGWSASAMAYKADWTATDQVPQRAIDNGVDGRRFHRFDSLDPTTGGDTHRYSLSGEWRHESDFGRSKVSAYAINYELDLNSNFTYELERGAAGDQFKQTDKRNIFGLDASQTFDHKLGSLDARSEVGLSLRHDRARVGLFDSVARQVTSTIREDKVRETMLGLYGQTAFEIVPNTPPRARCADRRQQRALVRIDDDEPASGLSIQPQRRSDARCLQPAEQRGQRHPVLL